MRPTPSIVAAVATLLAGVPAAVSQAIDRDGVPETELATQSALETSYVLLTKGWGTLDPLVLEANLAPHLVFDMHDLRIPIFGGFINQIAVTPKINLRIFDTRSAPVRAPSFMPQVAFYHWGDPPGDAPADFWTLRISHHSNGQEGDFYLPDGTHNRASGSFSSNFVELGWTQAFGPHPTRHAVFLSEYGVEVYPNINMSPELEEGFGRLRLKWKARYLARVNGQGSPWLETSLESVWRTWSYPGVGAFDRSRWSARVGVIYTHQKVRDVGLMADLYLGPDYYNINFDRHVTALRLGVMFNFGGVARPHPQLTETR